MIIIMATTIAIIHIICSLEGRLKNVGCSLMYLSGDFSCRQ